MAVELEEIALFGLFTYGGRTMQIREEHFKDIEVFAKELIPIPLDYQKLYRLGFLRNSDGTVFRQQGISQFILRGSKDGKWEFFINGGERIRVVSHIHQVQRLWFDLFDDHLFLPGNAERKKSQLSKPKTGTFQKRH